jgi:hypothetical protein
MRRLCVFAGTTPRLVARLCLRRKLLPISLGTEHPSVSGCWGSILGLIFNRGRNF